MNNYNYLSSELCKLGLNKKEADVYLVLLELGYCSVQKIAEKVDLSRPTVYRVLKSLEKKSLINTIEKGKRSYFIAGSPDTLLNMLRIKKRQAEEQEREFLRIINTLQGQYSFSSKENVIDKYRGDKQTLALERLVSTQSREIFVIINRRNSMITKSIQEIQKRLSSSVKIKEIQFFSAKSEGRSVLTLKKENRPKSENLQNMIIADEVFIFNRNSIQVVKQKEIVESYRMLFEIAFRNSAR